MNHGLISYLDNCIPLLCENKKNFFIFFKTRVQKVQKLEVLYTNT